MNGIVKSNVRFNFGDHHMAQRANLQAVLLAAGKSTRFKTEQSKLSFLICGQEMILYPVKMLQKMNIPTTLIVGYQKEQIIDIVRKSNLEATFAEQPVQKGTGHAVLCSRPYWSADHILIMNGDCPLLDNSIIENLIERHMLNKAAVSFVTSHNNDPALTGYGRVVKDGGVVRVIEQKDLTTDPSLECCINAGMYLFDRTFLEKNIESIAASAQTGEIYLPELIRMAGSQGLHVETVQVPFDTVRGVNTLKELWAAEHIKRSELIAYWMSQGVRFSSPQNVHLDITVTIGSGTVIGSGVVLTKNSSIGSHCSIGAFATIENSVIHDNVHILSHSVLSDSTIHHGAHIGPFAHIRNGTTIGNESCVGNFVEISASSVGSHTKAKHLSYLGNASVGSSVNIGAGMITCNYDGVAKNPTVIKDGAFIGSHCALVAPVVIGQEAMVGAGSTITEDVPDAALAIARERQTNKEGYAHVIRAKKRCQHSSNNAPCLQTPCE